MINLTPEQITALEIAGQKLDEIDRELKRAEAAGIDVSALRDEHAQYESLRAGMLKIYGMPGRKKTF